MERLYDEPDPLRTFGLALMASVLGGGICLWLSKLTGGVPAVNYLTWFGFLACMAAAVMVAAGALMRIVGMGFRVRARGPAAGAEPDSA